MSATEAATDAATQAYDAATQAYDAATQAYGATVAKLQDVDWPDVALTDVLDDVSVTVRRHPRAALAIIALTVVATCGVFWFAMRRRTGRTAAEETELALAGVA